MIERVNIFIYSLVSDQIKTFKVDFAYFSDVQVKVVIVFYVRHSTYRKHTFWSWFDFFHTIISSHNKIMHESFYRLLTKPWSSNENEVDVYFQTILINVSKFSKSVFWYEYVILYRNISALLVPFWKKV